METNEKKASENNPETEKPEEGMVGIEKTLVDEISDLKRKLEIEFVKWQAKYDEAKIDLSKFDEETTHAWGELGDDGLKSSFNTIKEDYKKRRSIINNRIINKNVVKYRFNMYQSKIFICSKSFIHLFHHFIFPNSKVTQ